MSGIMGRKSSRSLSTEEAAHVRALVERLVREAGTQTELARRLGLSIQAISRVTLGEPPGVGIVRKLADMLGQTVEEVLGGPPPVPMEPRLSSLAGWPEAEQAARQLAPYIPDAAWRAVDALRTAHPPRSITPEWVAALASDWARALS